MKQPFDPKTLIGFFRSPVSPYPMAVFRILFGLCVCATLLLLHKDWLSWFGPHGWITMETIRMAESGFRLNLFAFFPQSDWWTAELYWLFLIASMALTVGLATRLSSVLVWLGLNSINQRMPLILHGGDTFLRDASFFLCFASSGAVLSLDAKVRRMVISVQSALAPRVAAWPHRLIQYQLVIIYLASFWWKVQGAPWRDGTALYYVINLREIQRFAVPHFLHEPSILHLGTWIALAFEISFPIFVWFKLTRRWVLIAGIVFHLCLEYALNIPMFQWDMLSAYVLFVDPIWLERLITNVSRTLGLERSHMDQASCEDFSSR